MQFQSLTFKDKKHAEAFVERMEANISTEQDDHFHITDCKKCDWVIKKITAVDDEIDRLEEQHRRRVKQLENEKKFFELRFGHELEGFVRANLDGRKKSIDFAHGRAGFRKSQETIEIIDPDAACEWAKENCPDALRSKEWVIKTPLIKYLTETGELPEGTAHKPAEDRFYIS